MFEPLSCYYGLAELPDLTNKSVPQLWRMYRRAVKKNMPPLEVYADYLDPDLVWWIAFNIQLKLFEALPYDSTCLLQESIRAMAYSWGNKDEELMDWAKSFPAEIMNFLRSSMRPDKTVETEQRLLNTWASVSYWQAGNYVLEIPISGFDCIQEAKEFGDNIKGISRRVKGCSIFTITSNQVKECPSDYVVIYSFREGGQRQCSCLSELVPTNLEVCQLSMAKELVDDYRFLHSICRGSSMDDSQQHSQQVDWDSIPKDERTWYASHGGIVYSGDVQPIEADKHNIYGMAIDFFGVGTEESEDFYISQKIPGDPSRGIPSLEIEQVADRVTINELTPNGFAQVYASHQENPETGWKQCPEIGWSLNDLERIERILDGKVDLSTGIDSSWVSDNTYKKKPQTNTFWITHEASYIKSKTTCITTTKSIAQVLNDCYYILCEGYEIFDDHCEGRINDLISDCEPLPESVCHLLVKYFGYEISQWTYDATEIDLLYIWQGPRIPEIGRTDKASELWRNLTRFRPGFYPELFAIMKGEIDPHNMPHYPWIGKYSCITGWVAGDYILELPFGCFHTEEEALQFGRFCHAIQSCQEPSTVMWLHYWDDRELERISFQISDLTVYKKPDGFVEGGYRGYEDLEPADVPAQEIPVEEIGAPAYMYSSDHKSREI